MRLDTFPREAEVRTTYAAAAASPAAGGRSQPQRVTAGLSSSLSSSSLSSLSAPDPPPAYDFRPPPGKKRKTRKPAGAAPAAKRPDVTQKSEKPPPANQAKQVCYAFLAGGCSRKVCKFAHERPQCLDFLAGRCRRESCRFAPCAQEPHAHPQSPPAARQGPAARAPRPSPEPAARAPELGSYMGAYTGPNAVGGDVAAPPPRPPGPFDFEALLAGGYAARATIWGEFFAGLGALWDERPAPEVACIWCGDGLRTVGQQRDHPARHIGPVRAAASERWLAEARRFRDGLDVELLRLRVRCRVEAKALATTPASVAAALAAVAVVLPPPSEAPPASVEHGGVILVEEEEYFFGSLPRAPHTPVDADCPMAAGPADVEEIVAEPGEYPMLALLGSAGGGSSGLAALTADAPPAAKKARVGK